jgi:hypothetical protein
LINEGQRRQRSKSKGFIKKNMNALTSPAVIGGIAGGIAVIIIALLQKVRICPKCKTPLPKFRKPANSHQMLWGGWTCQKCGSEIDRKGNLIKKSK